MTKKKKKKILEILNSPKSAERHELLRQRSEYNNKLVKEWKLLMATSITDNIGKRTKRRVFERSRH